MGRGAMQGRIPGPYPEDLSVFETMRAEPDGRIALWRRHLQRLRQGCAAVGFALDEARLATRLEEVPRGRALRVRVAVDATGGVALGCADLPASPALWRATVSPSRLCSDDPWLRVKTSHRPVYDAARAGLRDGIDEVVLLNERGEVCEGSITNIFLDREGVMLTPPLSCGVLPGVQRAELLDSGQACEQVLRIEDLAGGKLLFGNALRGLIPAVLVSGVPDGADPDT